MVNVASVVHQYGYPLVFAVVFVEGEVLLMAAGWAAHQGWLSMPAVIVVAAASAFTSNLTFYALGRRYGPQLRRRWPALAGWWLPVIESWLERWSHTAIIGVRFAFWLRIPGLVLLGDAGIGPREFALFSVVGVALWAPLVAGVGWTYGAAIGELSRGLRVAELAGLLLFVVIGLILALTRRRLGRRG